jgi:hypothetical protein
MASIFATTHLVSEDKLCIWHGTGEKCSARLAFPSVPETIMYLLYTHIKSITEGQKDSYILFF